MYQKNASYHLKVDIKSWCTKKFFIKIWHFYNCDKRFLNFVNIFLIECIKFLKTLFLWLKKQNEKVEKKIKRNRKYLFSIFLILYFNIFVLWLFCFSSSTFNMYIPMYTLVFHYFAFPLLHIICTYLHIARARI